MKEISPSIFFDPARASKSLASLFDMFIEAGSRYAAEEFSDVLALTLQQSPDPDLAVTNLLRFVESSHNKAALFNDLMAYPVLLDVLTKLLSSSQYFADILVRDPELFRWLTATDALVHPRSKAFLREEVGRVMKMFHKPDSQRNGLRRLYRREVLRIGARDILGEASLQIVTEELSSLADCLVDAACTIAHQQLADKFPVTPQASYAVIGLGKLGGSELNYSSDIDIIFVYEDEGELLDARSMTRTYHEYFNAFVEKLVGNLTETTAEGYLYRVDTRLRPESGAGPLARSGPNYLLYYESRGELWERQMLIKARPIAGDIDFGIAFLKQLDAFVYPRSLLQNPREYIARIKARIEAAIVGEENVKLRAGGIRDIEFIIQALQLIHGGKVDAIRSGNTLAAIPRLVAHGLLSSDEAQILSEGYEYFRNIEHRLQTMFNTQTHEMPKDSDALTVLARKVGESSSADLQTTYSGYLTQVRKIFDTVFESDAAQKDLTLLSAFEGNTSIEVLSQLMAAYGFTDIRKAARNLATMIAGSAFQASAEFDIRTRDSFREIAENLIREIVKTPSPDLTLQNLSQLVSAHKFADQFYRQLQESQFRNLVLTICSKSPRMAKGIAQHPLLLESLSIDPEVLAGSRPGNPSESEGLGDYKSRHEILAGIRYLLGIYNFNDLSRELTRIADAVFAEALRVELNAAHRKRMPLAVFAMGKYGTQEINFDSDLDVLFISDVQSPTAKSLAEKLATKIVGRMSLYGEHGKLYDVDARLRPEGRSAPLVVDRQAYLAYLGKRSSLWERQSLTRFRFVSGDETVGKRVISEVAEFAFQSLLPPDWVQQIVTMRRKTETRSIASRSELLDIKLGAGGMVDIEFLAQMFQLRYGGLAPHLASLTTVDAINAYVRGESKQGLVETYHTYREIETLMRLTLEDRGTTLPHGGRLEVLAKTYDGSSGESFHAMIASRMASTRKQFLSLSKQLTHEST